MSEELESQEVTETEQVEAKADRKSITMGSILGLLSLTMFIGGALVTLMLLARSFEVHGMALLPADPQRQRPYTENYRTRHEAGIKQVQERRRQQRQTKTQRRLYGSAGHRHQQHSSKRQA